jgi:uncharacterized protein YjiS (DUF1127 family)
MRVDQHASGVVVAGERDDLASWTSQVASIPVNLWARFVRMRDNRRALAALEALDDRMLKDIGISRQQIAYAVTRGRRWD